MFSWGWQERWRVILRLGGKRAEVIATGYILRVLKGGFESRPCALEERENLLSPFEDPLPPWATAVFAT